MFAGATGADTKTLGMHDVRQDDEAVRHRSRRCTRQRSGTALFPSFLPTNDAVVFELETRYNGRDYGGTRSDDDASAPPSRRRSGTHAELWWLDLKTQTANRALDNLNGKDAAGASYLPTGPNAHDDDTTLNYEPTVNPVPSGGYAWVVFTSRRLYGNVATINPFYSDPRYHDLTATPTPEEALGRGDRSERARRHRSQPSRVLPPGAGAARGQLARLLGRRSVQVGRQLVRDRRRVLRRLLPSRTGRQARLHRDGPVVRAGVRELRDERRLLQLGVDPVHQRSVRGTRPEVSDS